jgi:type II secretory pathway component PulK
MIERTRTIPAPRGSVVLAVVWMIALGAIIVAGVQLAGYRQAMLGRHVHAQVQARWAARGGIEYTLAIMASHTEHPEADNAFALIQDMEAIWTDDFELGRRLVASYDLRHFADGREWRGPMDLHSKINVNAAVADPSLFVAFEDMPPDVIDAIRDWVDEDDEPGSQGAERDYYLSGSVPYEPRNAPMRSIGELELVAGIWPEHLRGEDWNLDDRLDPNEDDADRTWPDDSPDGILQGGWAAYLTTHTTGGGPTASGEPRIWLREAEPADLEERLDVEPETAEALIAFGQDRNARMEQLLSDYVSRNFADQIATGSQDPTGQFTTPGQQGQQPTATTPSLTREELVAVLAETAVDNPEDPGLGRLNINTISEELLRKLLYGREHLADEILYLRNSQAEGITSLVDLTDIPAFQEDPSSLESIARNMDVQSNVYAISARGRSNATGLEVEIIAVVDRSTLPIRILEYREQ